MRDEGIKTIKSAKAYITTVKKTVAEVKTQIWQKDKELAQKGKEITVTLKTALQALPADDPVAAKKQKSTLQKEAAAQRKTLRAQRLELKELLQLCK